MRSIFWLFAIVLLVSAQFEEAGGEPEMEGDNNAFGMEEQNEEDPEMKDESQMGQVYMGYPQHGVHIDVNRV